MLRLNVVQPPRACAGGTSHATNIAFCTATAVLAVVSVSLLPLTPAWLGSHGRVTRWPAERVGGRRNVLVGVYSLCDGHASGIEEQPVVAESAPALFLVGSTEPSS